MSFRGEGEETKRKEKLDESRESRWKKGKEEENVKREGGKKTVHKRKNNEKKVEGGGR